MSMFPSLRRAVMLSVVVAANLQAQFIRSTSTFSMSALPANDDGSTGLVNVGFAFNFYGVAQNNLYVNNNGNVTFAAPLSTFTPFGLINSNIAIIAPFFADVDTRGAGNNLTRYGQGTIGGRNAFAVDWLNVGYFDSRVDKLNSFQLMMIDRTDTGAGNFDFEFNYGSMQWDTGSASGGVGGLCGPNGSPARVGYTNGAAVDVEVAGSGVCGAFVDNGPNSLQRIGRLSYSVRNGVVIDPPSSSVPEPATYATMAMGLAGIALAARRRRVVNVTGH